MNLPCSTILYRAITNPEHINEDRAESGIDFTLDAFVMSPQDKALSTQCSDAWDAPEDYASYFDSIKRKHPVHCYGIASLHTGKVRDLGLKVILDPPNPSKPGRHVSIDGIPLLKEQLTDLDKKKMAEDFATALAHQARLKWPT